MSGEGQKDQRIAVVGLGEVRLSITGSFGKP